MQVLCGVTMFCNFAPWLEKLNKKSEGMEDTTFLLLMWCVGLGRICGRDRTGTLGQRVQRYITPVGEVNFSRRGLASCMKLVRSPRSLEFCPEPREVVVNRKSPATHTAKMRRHRLGR